MWDELSTLNSMRDMVCNVIAVSHDDTRIIIHVSFDLLATELIVK